MTSSDVNVDNKEVKGDCEAPGALEVRKQGETGRLRNLIVAPKGNRFAQTHGARSSRWTPEEDQERADFEQGLIEDLGGNPTLAQLTLIRRAAFIEMRLKRSERASRGGIAEIPSEHILSWINSQRLLLTTLGLEKKVRPAMSLKDYVALKDAESKRETELAKGPEQTQ